MARATSARMSGSLVTSPGIGGFGSWVEQLLAESTGKHGVGLVPVDGEPLPMVATAGDDRLFAYVRLGSEPDGAQDAAMAAMAAAGHPVVRLDVERPLDLGGEMFRWEVATAVAGAVLGIHPFDQPDVEAAKIAARDLMAKYETTGSLPTSEPVATSGALALFADERNTAQLVAETAGDRSLQALLAAHLRRTWPGDYVALLGFVPRQEPFTQVMQELRTRIRDARHVATCVGFGPRFLHSTGQLHKGGPGTGLFIQVTCDDARDVNVPGKAWSFGVVKAAQASGDLAVLSARGRRAVRIYVSGDLADGLAQLSAAVEAALPA